MADPVTDRARPKNIKSRSGCKACKERRLRCDETIPACRNCLKRQVPCPGYKQVYRWLDKCQTNKHDFSVGRRSKAKCERQPPTAALVDKDASQLTHTMHDKFFKNACFSIISREKASHDPTNALQMSSDNTTHEQRVTDWSIATSTERYLPSRPTLTLAQMSEPVFKPLYNPFEGRGVWPTFSPNDFKQILDTSASTTQRSGVRSLLKGYYGLHNTVPTPLVHQDSRLVEYYFSTTSGIYSCFDSHLNPFRSFVGQMWTFSPSMYYAIQSMAAAHLANELPSKRRVGADLHYRASQSLSQELSQSFGRGRLNSQLLLVLLLVGLTTSWHRPNDLGLSYLRTARSLLQTHPAFNGQSCTHGTDKLQDVFEEAMVYWEMMASFVVNEADVDVMHQSSDDAEFLATSLQHLSLDGTLISSGQVSPHPWTGISPQSQMLLAQVGRLVRRVRNHDRQARRAAEARYFPIAQSFEKGLMAASSSPTTPPVESGDMCTKTSHLLTLAQVTRDCALLELYRVFPNLLQHRIREDTYGILNLDLDDENDEVSVFEEPAPTHQLQSWLTSFALSILKSLESIPDSSSVRCHQMVLLLIAAAELRLPSHHATDSHLFNISEMELEIRRARRFARSRLSQLAVRLPAQPVRVTLDILDEVWRRLDDTTATGTELSDDVFWMDIVIEKGWHTIMG